MTTSEPAARAADDAMGVLHFPDGLPGFENLRDFVLLRDDELLPIVFLTSLGEPRVCFPVLPMHRIERDYRLRLSDDDRRALELCGEPVVGANVLCLAILNLGDGAQPVSANLLAPIVINRENWIGRQVIQVDSPYSAAVEV